MKTKLSVCLAVRNEEKNIGRCLTSIKDWADEIVIVDGCSTDKTATIAASLGAKVIKAKHELMFHRNKQKAIDAASGDWILLLDADEEVTPSLRDEIKDKIFKIKNSEQKLNTNGYWIPRKNIIFNKWIEHTGWWPDYQLRLFKKGKVSFPCRSVHEDPVLTGQSGRLKAHLTHYHYQTVSQYLQRLDVYTDNDADFFLSKKEKIKWQDAMLWPLDEFIKRFVAWQGYKDGLHGLVLSLLQSMNRLVVFAKIWERNDFYQEDPKDILLKMKKVFDKKGKELIWWQKEEKINKTTSPLLRFFLKLKRKIAL